MPNNGPFKELGEAEDRIADLALLEPFAASRVQGFRQLPGGDGTLVARPRAECIRAEMGGDTTLEWRIMRDEKEI